MLPKFPPLECDRSFREADLNEAAGAVDAFAWGCAGGSGVELGTCRRVGCPQREKEGTDDHSAASTELYGLNPVHVGHKERLRPVAA